jgi:pimeloyl-ACP methyl ester carboxylesterase
MTTVDDATVSRAVSRDGTEVGYFTTGHGPPLVLVHGGLGDHTRWRVLRPYLEPHFTVHAMDRRGRGASGDHSDTKNRTPTGSWNCSTSASNACSDRSGDRSRDRDADTPWRRVSSGALTGVTCSYMRANHGRRRSDPCAPLLGA